MTVNQIFDTIQYGEKYTKEKALKESISKYYDEELGLFYASKRIKNIAKDVVLSESEEQKVNRLTSKFTVLEDRLETGKIMSEAYRKMQTAALMEDCKTLIEGVTATRKVDSRKLEIIGKIVATSKYFVESNLDDKAILKESSNVLLNKIIKEEKESLEKIL